MLTTPILNDIKTFNADKDKIITFDVFGGNQVTGNNLIIERLEDNAEIYNKTQENFNFKHTIPAGSLINGTNYRARIRTKDRDENWSNFSENLLFWSFSEPELIITTIDYENQNRVYNQTVLFSTDYSQSENEMLQSYRYVLYNANKELMTTFPEYYVDGSQPLTEEVAGLENGTLYYIEVITLSPNGNEGSSGLVNFKPFYMAPRFTVTLTPENLPEEGAIKVSANILQIVLELYDNNGNQINPENVEYIDGEMLDMNRVDYERLVAKDGFTIWESDFILQLWCKDIPEDEVFLTLYSPEGRMEVVKLNNRIRVYKYIHNLEFRNQFASNEVIIEDGQDLMIYIKQDNHLLDVVVEII